MIKEKIETVFGEVRPLLEDVTDGAVEELIRRLEKARAVFFSAQGRSGCVLRCFCMRLMHLGYRVYFCGETITPAIGPGDLLVVLSGSGATTSTFEAVQIARRRGAMTCGILGNLGSRISPLLDQKIHLPGTTKLRRKVEPGSQQMPGSLFEQAAFILLEAVVLALYEKKRALAEESSALHAVIE